MWNQKRRKGITLAVFMYGYFGYETHRKVAGYVGKSKVKKRGTEGDGIGGCGWILLWLYGLNGIHHGESLWTWNVAANAYGIFVLFSVSAFVVCVFVCPYDGVMRWNCPFIGRPCICHDAFHERLSASCTWLSSWSIAPPRPAYGNRYYDEPETSMYFCTLNVL